MKLAAYRSKDQMHLRDMIDVGLIDESWVGRFIPELGQRLQSILDYEKLLTTGTTPITLDLQASAMSDNDAAERVQLARKKLFQLFNRRSKSAA